MPSAQIATGQRKRKPYRTYDADQVALILSALDANHGNARYTADQFGVNESTVRSMVQWSQRNTAKAARVRALRAAKRDDLAGTFEDAAWEAIQQGRDKLPEASARDAIVFAGICVDKAQALRGAPTLVVEHRHTLASLTPEQKRQLLAAWRATLRQAEAQASPVTVDAPALSASPQESAPGA